MSEKLCECGCGAAVKGVGSRFWPGHNRRGKTFPGSTAHRIAELERELRKCREVSDEVVKDWHSECVRASVAEMEIDRLRFALGKAATGLMICRGVLEDKSNPTQAAETAARHYESAIAAIAKAEGQSQ